MGVESHIKTARKLGNFVASLFPAAARRGAQTSAWLRGLPLTARLQAALAWVRRRPRVAALGALVASFYWSNYRDERVDWGRLPPERAAALRPAFVVTLVLALGAPLAMLAPWPPVAVGAAGARPAALW